MAEQFQLLCAVGAPDAFARLSMCCRVFRTIFSDDGLWKTLCEERVGEDACAKQPSETWRSFYGAWVLSPRAWFSAYTHLAFDILNVPSFQMRLDFDGTDLPEEWADAESLCLGNIRVTSLGISGETSLHWSENRESIPCWWPLFQPKPISKVRVLAGETTYCHTLLEIDSGEPGRGGLEFAESKLAEWAGLSIRDDHYCEGEPYDWAENMHIKVNIPMARVLSAVLGADEARVAAAEWLGRSPTPPHFTASDDLMLFTEFATHYGVVEDTVAMAKLWPSPTWYSPQHAFYFRRCYPQQWREWNMHSKDERDPVFGYKFHFNFDDNIVSFSEHSKAFTSLWCLDSCGVTSFAQHGVLCSFTTKQPFGLLEPTAVAVTPASEYKILLCELQSMQNNDAGGQDIRLAGMNILMAPFCAPRGFDRGALLNAVHLDDAKRLLHRAVAHQLPTSTSASAEEAVTSRAKCSRKRTGQQSVADPKLARCGVGWRHCADLNDTDAP